MTTNFISVALNLSLLGMSLVFMFLLLLVLACKIMSVLLTKLALWQDSSAVSANDRAIITLAIHKHFRS